MRTNQRLHILMVPSWYEERKDRGGGLFFHQKAKYLASAGIKVDLLHAHLEPFGPLIPRTGVMEMNGFNIWSKRSFAWPKRWGWSRRRWHHQFADWIEQYEMEEGKPDIIHAHGYEAASVAGEIGNRWKVPVIYSEHLSRLLEDNLKDHQEILFRQAAQTASLLTGVSSDLSAQMEEKTGKEVRTIPNMIDTDFFHPNPDRTKQNILLSIGDPWHIKGLDVLIEAVGRIATEHPNIQLHLGDRIPGKNKLYPLIDRYDLQNQVKFLGYLSPEEVRDQMQEATALVSASRTETFGMTMVEAISCGTPVLATPTAGAKDILSPETGMLLNGFGVGEMTKGLEQILAFPTDPERMHDYARKRFDRGVLCDHWRTIYCELVDLNPQTS